MAPFFKSELSQEMLASLLCLCQQFELLLLGSLQTDGSSTATAGNSTAAQTGMLADLADLAANIPRLRKLLENQEVSNRSSSGTATGLPYNVDKHVIVMYQPCFIGLHVGRSQLHCVSVHPGLPIHK